MHQRTPLPFRTSPVRTQMQASNHSPSLSILATQAGVGILLAPWLPQGLGLALVLGALLLMLTHARLRRLLLLSGGIVLLHLLKGLRRLIPSAETRSRLAAARTGATVHARAEPPRH